MSRSDDPESAIYDRVEGACSGDHILVTREGFVEVHWSDLVRFERANRAAALKEAAMVCDRAARECMNESVLLPNRRVATHPELQTANYVAAARAIRALADPKGQP